MSNIREEIQELNNDQLHSLRDYVDQLIARKRAEKKLTVWCVGDESINHKCFRHDQYLLAVEYFEKLARSIDADKRSDRYDRELRITADRVPESEYESYFEDK